jgi:hypothetical protein
MSEKIDLAQLDQFTGTENWYRHSMLRGVTFTDGVKYLADKAGAYWLIDQIAFAQKDRSLTDQTFQVWHLTVNADKSADLKTEDGNYNVIRETRIPFTDFPTDKITLWVEDGGPELGRVILLPSEH